MADFRYKKGIRFGSIDSQKPQDYFQLKDKYPMYEQIQRTQASINGFNISFRATSFDQNLFLKSKAYIKLSVRIKKQDIEIDNKEQEVDRNDVNYLAVDRIYKKPGMVLMNSCTNATLSLNGHSIQYPDLRYLQKKMNISCGGRMINDKYLTTSGSCYPDYCGVYNQFGDVSNSNETTATNAFLLTDLGFNINNTIEYTSQTKFLNSASRGFDQANNTVTFVAGTKTLSWQIGGGVAIDIVDGLDVNGIKRPILPGEIMQFNGFVGNPRFQVVSVVDLASVIVSNLDNSGNQGPLGLQALDTYKSERQTGRIRISEGAGGAIVNLIDDQIFNVGDKITIAAPAGVFRVLGVLGQRDLLVGDCSTPDVQDFAEQKIGLADGVTSIIEKGFNGDCCRQIAYDDAFKDITINQTTSIFQFTEPLSIGIFNPYADNPDDICKKSFYNKQSSLIPYIKRIGLDFSFKDIAANALVYQYGRQFLAAGLNNTVECNLEDVEIVSAELVLFWVRPRPEMIAGLPKTVRLQSWTYDHKQFPLGIVNNNDTIASEQNQIYTSQLPTDLYYFGMVDKDSSNYNCTAINSDVDGVGNQQNINLDKNSVEAGMSINNINNKNGGEFRIRSNNLGGDNLIDNNYNPKELYRITLKNSIADFPWGHSKFLGLSPAETQLATYPSEFFIKMSEDEMDKYNVRKGQLIQSHVLDYSSTLVARDGYSIDKLLPFNGGNKQYAVHIFYVYDRYYIELSSNGHVNAKFDSQFY